MIFLEFVRRIILQNRSRNRRDKSIGALFKPTIKIYRGRNPPFPRLGNPLFFFIEKATPKATALCMMLCDDEVVRLEPPSHYPEKA
jgi:hypothetical protein